MVGEVPSRSGLAIFKGSAGLIAAIAVVAILLIVLPYRVFFLIGVFFLISVLIGIVIAGGLTLWHRWRPIKEEEVHNKRPLGL